MRKFFKFSYLRDVATVVALLLSINATISSGFADLVSFASSALNSQVTTLGSTVQIHAATADGADNQELDITAGGAYATDASRGAIIRLTGNENGGQAGGIKIEAGLGSAGAATSIMNPGTAAGNATTFLKSTGSAMWSLPDTGDLLADTTNGGNLKLEVAGKGVFIKEGANAKMGTAVCNGTTEVTVSTTAVTASTRIFLTENTVGGTPLGVTYVSARSAGASFGFKCAATDTSTVAWLLMEPS